MRRVVLSVNENPQYTFYLPLVVWAWRKFGWEPIIFYTDSAKIPIQRMGMDTGMFHRLVVEGYGSDTVAQISRLYAACLYSHNEDYMMTSDADMLPLSDYWNPDPEKITVWGHDLTGFQHMPICYIGMKKTRWVEVMALTNHNYNLMIERDLKKLPNAKNADSEKRWVVDQDLITERINSVTFAKEFVPRGSGANGYPIGRVDRSAWSLDHPKFVDCHMLRDIWKNPDHLAKTMLLLYKIWPQEDFTWFTDYVEEFKKRNP